MFVQSSSNSRGDAAGSARRSRCEKSGHDRQHAGAREAERLELLAVELRVAERQVAAVGVGAQLAAAAEALARQRPVDADEVLRRRDVVVDERHPVGQRERRARRLRAEREMVEQQVVGMAGVDQLAVVARQRLEPAVGGLDEDLRLVAGARAARAGCRAPRGRSRRRSRAWRAPDGPRITRASVVPRRRRQPPARRQLRRARPRAARQVAAGGASNQPGSGSIAAARGGSLSCSRSNMSRYFRSITGQS